MKESKKECGVYAIIENETNETIYIGSSKNLKKRFYAHRYLAFYHKCQRLALYDYIESKCENMADFDKKFRFTVLRHCEPGERKKTEGQFIMAIRPKMNIKGSSDSKEMGLNHEEQRKYRSENKAEWNAYHLAWQHKNAEKWKAYQKTWHEKKKAEKLLNSKPSAK